MTYRVRVSDNWEDERRESKFLITASSPRAAEIAALQLFAQQAALDHTAVGACEAVASAP